MARDHISIAQAIEDHINANKPTLLDPELTVVRGHRIERDLPEFATTRVTVIPGLWEKDIASKAHIARNHFFTVVVQRKLGATEETDAWVDLSEQVNDLFDFHTVSLTEYTPPITASWIGTISDVPYDAGLLQEASLFSSAFALQYLLHRNGQPA